MKRIALLLLALMMVLFFVTLNRPESWAGWMHAFAEAAMVGAIADWFAVVALFRHPLRIPIPHTAIIPRRKNEIGENLAQFVAEHFLSPDVVRLKIESVNLAGKASEWLKSPAGHARALDFGLRLASWLLGTLNEQRVRDFMLRLGSRQLGQVNLAPLLGRLLDWLVQGGRHQEVLTQSLRFSLVLLHDNRELIRGNVQGGSPWWMPGFVDDRIVVQLLDRIEMLLLEMSLDPDHVLRKDFNGWMVRWAKDLQTSPEYRQWGEQIKEGLLDNNDLQEYLGDLWGDLLSGVQADLDDPESEIRKQLSELLSGLADELEKDQQMQAWVNTWLVDSTVSLVDANRHSMASLISDTVRSWDASETSNRIEQAIGRDLQFIRINGTLVGGLVGLVIHAIKLA
jgi:uncharacterized membrane-anchored protein YjiN (DUF445 family)